LIPDGLAPAGLVELLADDGWQLSPQVHVMTAELGPVVKAARPHHDVRLDTEPDDAWLAAYRQDDGPLSPAARPLLADHPAVVFASVRDEERCIAVARAAVDDRWAGLFAVEVAPEHRRSGLGLS